MGQIVNGKWEQNPPEVLPATTPFANWLTKDGSNGPDGQQGFKAEKGRYHLYLNLGCPFAHRAHLAHALKGLDNLVDISITDPARTSPDFGWSFAKGFPRTTGDKVFPEHKNVYEVYVKSDPNATARASVPILFDTETNKIVSAESADIVRQFSEAFNDLGAKEGDFYPEAHRKVIEEADAWLQDNLSKHFYAARMGPADKREAAAASFKSALSELDTKLSSQHWIAGSFFSEADIRAFVVLIRYHVMGNKALAGFPNVFEWLKEFYQLPGVSNTVEISHILRIFYGHTQEADQPTDPKDYGLTEQFKPRV